MNFENLNNLSNLELIEIIKKLHKKVNTNKQYLTKYHNSEKGALSRSRANKKYADKLKLNTSVCGICDKKVQTRYMKGHEQSKGHQNKLLELNQSTESNNDN